MKKVKVKIKKIKGMKKFNINKLNKLKNRIIIEIFKKKKNSNNS